VYADKGQITVMSVKMLKAEKMDKMHNMSKYHIQATARLRAREPSLFLYTNGSMRIRNQR